jgi:hypothetical protein
MAGYQTYGTAMHANATALYDQAKPASCVTCAKVGAVISEPSNFRQATGLLSSATVGAGAVMTGVGVMDYGTAARDGKLQNITNNSNYASNNASATSSSRSNATSSSRSNAQNYNYNENNNYNQNYNSNANGNSNWNGNYN